MSNRPNNEPEEMVTVRLPVRIIEELNWLKEKSGASTLTEALSQAISTEAYILNEVEKTGYVLIGKNKEKRSN